RARYEGGFIRYQWVDRGTGNAGYWKALLPDGTVQFYGADSEGNLVAAAREGGEEGVFKYHLVEQMGRNGHKIRWDYGQFGNVTLHTRRRWGYDATGSNARFEVLMAYQARPDHVQDAGGGYLSVLDQRLTTLTVNAGGQLQSRYVLTYEDPA